MSSVESLKGGLLKDVNPYSHNKVDVAKHIHQGLRVLVRLRGLRLVQFFAVFQVKIAAVKCNRHRSIGKRNKEGHTTFILCFRSSSSSS